MKEIINSAIEIEVPEGFERMYEEDLNTVYGNEDPNRWGIWDKEKHIMITLTWQKNGLLETIADLKKVRDNAMTDVSKIVTDFKDMELTERKFSGEKAYGFRYGYRVEDVEQISEHLVIRHNGCLYALITACRKELLAASSMYTEAILNSIRLL